MRSRFKGLTAGVVILVAVAACDTDGNGDTAAAGLAGEGTGTDCTIENPVPVAATFSLTGAAASYGESQQNGMKLAAKQLAEQDGVEYDLTIEDDQTDPRQAITVFEKFVNDGVSVIVGPTLSTNAFQAQPVAQEAGVPVLAVSNTAEGITAQGDFIFRDSLTEAQVIPQTVAKAKEVHDLSSVVVMYANDDVLSESGYNAFADALEAEGIETLETLTFSKADTDFRSLLSEAKSARPDALVVSALIEAAIPLVTQARDLGIDAPILGGNGFNSAQLIADAGEAAEGVIVGAAWNSSSDSPENTGFLADFEDEFGHTPDQFAAQAYAGMMLIDHAVRAGCSGERDDIRDALAELQGIPTVLGEFSINEERDAEHPAVVQIIEDGRFAVLD